MLPLGVTLGPLLGLALLWITFPHAEAITVPLDLARPTTTSRPFTADYEHDYEIGLAVSPGERPEETVCMLGVEYPGLPLGYAKKQCGKRVSNLEVSWRITSHGRPVASGSTQPSQYGSRGVDLTRELGTAPLDRHRAFVVETSISRGAEDLRGRHPRLVIAVHPAVSEDEFVRRLFLGGVLLVVSALGLIWLSAAWALQGEDISPAPG